MSCTDSLGNVCDHIVRIHMYSIASPVVPEFTALRNAQRVYGPKGIKIEFVSGQSLHLTPSQALTLDVIDGACQWNSASDEQQLLYSLGGAPISPNKIRVYYVNVIRTLNGSSLNGCAGHEPQKPAVAVAASGSPWTLAHEIGHVLLGPSFRPVHTKSQTNLMFSPTASISANPPSLNAQQVAAIKNSRLCVAC